MKSFYDISINKLDGSPFDLNTLRGKKIMIVNVASRCGFTPQYHKLESLYKSFKSKNFVILALPCNDFGSQESGTSSIISSFCRSNFGVSFPILEKVKIKGKKRHPMYQWLCQKSQNGQSNNIVFWNFQKFLIDENGKLVNFLMPFTNPNSKKVIRWINS